MTWIKIDRDEYGNITQDCISDIVKKLPVVFGCNTSRPYYVLLADMIVIKSIHTHYLPIPKLIV